MNKDTPAFPADGVPGMTLRAYLVAHAPAAPEWFLPVQPEAAFPNSFPQGSDPARMVEKAKLYKMTRQQIEDETSLWDERMRQAVLDYMAAFVEAGRQAKANQMSFEREKDLQWPLAWADAMLEKLAE